MQAGAAVAASAAHSSEVILIDSQVPDALPAVAAMAEPALVEAGGTDCDEAGSQLAWLGRRKRSRPDAEAAAARAHSKREAACVAQDFSAHARQHGMHLTELQAVAAEEPIAVDAVNAEDIQCVVRPHTAACVLEKEMVGPVPVSCSHAHASAAHLVLSCKI